MEKRNTGLSIAALVLGIVAILLSFIPVVNFISFITGILALIFGIISVVNKNTKNGFPITAIILASLAFIIAIVINVATVEVAKDASKELDKVKGNATEEVLKNDVEVTLGNLEITKDEYGLTDTQLVVTVKNTTDSTKSYNIQVEAIDSTGKRIEEGYVLINNLGPGQTTTDKIFEYIEDEKLEAMKTAKFKIAKASVY